MFFQSSSSNDKFQRDITAVKSQRQTTYCVSDALHILCIFGVVWSRDTPQVNRLLWLKLILYLAPFSVIRDLSSQWDSHYVCPQMSDFGRQFPPVWTHLNWSIFISHRYRENVGNIYKSCLVECIGYITLHPYNCFAPCLPFAGYCHKTPKFWLV